jgi:hypothetical protein
MQGKISERKRKVDNKVVEFQSNDLELRLEAWAARAADLA